MTGDHIILLVLAIGTYISFIWALFFFFADKKAQSSAGMRLIDLTGSICMISHLLALILSRAGSYVLSLAIALFALSLILFWSTILYTWHRPLHVAYSNELPETVHKTGPFRWVRHPIYLSYTLAWIAGALGSAMWWTWLAVPLMLGQYIHMAHREERQFLTGELSEQYRDYMTTAGMFTPRF